MGKIKKTISRILLLLVLILVSRNLSAQQVLLDKNVEKQDVRNSFMPERGPNMRHFWGRTFSYGFIIPLSYADSLQIKSNLASNSLGLGYRYKLKLSEFLSIGTDIQYLRSVWHIEQGSRGNLIQQGVRHHSQKLITNDIGAGVYVRVNFARRGNTLGKFFDAGTGAQYVFSNRLVTTDNVEASKNGGANKIKTAASGLDYVNPIQPYILARAGFGRFAIICRYRLSNLFSASENIYGGRTLPNLSDLTIGLELTTFKAERPEPEREE
ncbi:MAG: hypothetical protein IT223_08850 [Crocinitomicaceae bacterium]|nr:hypothetical protein [Crocinitomicaceae bacterium]